MSVHKRSSVALAISSQLSLWEPQVCDCLELRRLLLQIGCKGCGELASAAHRIHPQAMHGLQVESPKLKRTGVWKREGSAQLSTRRRQRRFCDTVIQACQGGIGLVKQPQSHASSFSTHQTFEPWHSRPKPLAARRRDAAAPRRYREPELQRPDTQPSASQDAKKKVPKKL